MNTSQEPVGLLPPAFTQEYVEGATEPYITSDEFVGDIPLLPMIDLAFSKENAVPPHFWGMLYDGWESDAARDGGALFFQGYEHRGPHNERKKIYMTATTPDLYATQYAGKIGGFFDWLLSDANQGKPLMQAYYERYFDLYWDLHLGVTGDAIPDEVRQIGASFTTVLGYWYPTEEIVRDNILRVRALREPLKRWIAARVQDIVSGVTPHPEQTFVHYWLKNAGTGQHFREKDIVFECFHNFLAISQWGNMVYNTMAQLEPTHGDPTIQCWFARTMTSQPDEIDDGAFTPLDRFTMELFRTISPNRASLSTLHTLRGLRSGKGSLLTDHLAASHDPRHWRDPGAFNPDRYKTAPTTVDNDEASCQAAQLARCPFTPAPFAMQDGRHGAMTNSTYGAVYGEVEGQAYPVCDTAGYAPFGFGYRRCAGELLTIEFLKAFLRTAWREHVSFVTLDLEAPEQIPVSPHTVIADTISFTRAANGTA